MAELACPRRSATARPRRRNALRAFAAIAERAGLAGVTLRTLRHSTASALIAADEHIKVVQEMLGLSDDVVPGSNTVRFLIFSAAILLPAATVIIATKGRLGRVKEAVDTEAAVSDPDR